MTSVLDKARGIGRLTPAMFRTPAHAATAIPPRRRRRPPAAARRRRRGALRCCSVVGGWLVKSALHVGRWEPLESVAVTCCYDRVYCAVRVSAKKLTRTSCAFREC